jgi:alpha-L-rhamnosidase
VGTRRSGLYLVSIWFIFCCNCPSLASGLGPERLRCEYQKDPIGVDRVLPQLSWIVVADPQQRGKYQSAYQIIVAEKAGDLSSDRGDQWDSGRVPSSETLHIEYAGKPLTSNHQYFWKVRVWDESGNPSAWSYPASFTMGMLHQSDWQAKWITDPDILVPPEAESEALRDVNSGYQSSVVRDPNIPQWVGVDLGSPFEVDTVELYPATRYTFQEGSGTVSFPERYRIELADRADFSDAKIIADLSERDSKAPEIGHAVAFHFSPSQARYVRIYVTRLCAENELFANFALAEMKVLANGKNLASGKKVIAKDSAEEPGWSKEFLTDGIIEAVRMKVVRQPATWIRKEFQVKGSVKRATVFATARGVYELHLNGRRIGSHILAPEWTSYHKRSQYQGYDVTPELQQGANAIGGVLSHGWYAGRVGLMPNRRVYGKIPELLVQLDIEYADGHHQVVVTDGTWRRTDKGPIVSTDVYDGETYDARKEMTGWDKPGYNDSSWKPAVVSTDHEEALLSWQPNEPILAHRELKPISMLEPVRGVYIFDLGQNMVGHVRLRVNGPGGTVVRIRHAEMLKEDGELYTDNLRDAWQIDRYTKRTDGEETYEPHFTYHGFRYVELVGLSHPPTTDAVTGVVEYSSAPEVGEFETSSNFINKLHSNIVWTQHANMEGIPTDCPQRPERLGWTGDIQTFAQSAIFNMQMASFLGKYLRDMRDDQDADGRFPDVAPDPFDADPNAVQAFKKDRLKGSPGWGDAGTVLPWKLWVNYGDKQMLAEQYDAAKAWVDFIERNNPDLLWKNERGLDPGDWLNGDTLIWPGWPRHGATLPLEVHATAFFAHSADLVSRMAAVLGKEQQAEHYRDLFNRIKSAFNRAYVQADGRMLGDAQGGYALALRFDLLPEAQRTKAVQRMIELFSRYDGHLSTGFQSTHRLMLELTRAGRSDEAYRVLMIGGFPSWRLMIENGATTIWERWDGYVQGRGFQMPVMNSFNHYAFGAVEEWMWRNIVGLNPDEQSTAYKHFIMRPELGGGLSWARGSYDSIRGQIRSDWKLVGSQFTLSISVPANTTATVYLPVGKGSIVTESGRPIAEAAGVRASREDGVVEVQSGNYRFEVEQYAPATVVAE